MQRTLISTALISAALLTGCGDDEGDVGGIDPQLYTDSLFHVMNSGRANYTELIIERLGPDGVGVIEPEEHWEDIHAGAPLPAQMFRLNSERVAEETEEFTYSLQSEWPINSQNAPRTDMEEEGLEYISDNPGNNFYGEEDLGDTTYYTAVYPDVAVTQACVTCHNEHQDSPRDDFEIGDVMGGVVIRVPMN